MKSIVVQEFGEPSVLQLQEVPTPIPGPGQVLVRVHAIGVNPVETYIRAGTYAKLPPLPYTPGGDVGGVVEAVGEGVAHVAVGSRVYTFGTITGAYAEYALCESTQIYPLPDNITFAQGAALGIPYGTAHRALFGRAEAQPGESVLVHGASGGVGIAAVQLAVAHGMTVIGTAGSGKGMQLVSAQGAQYVYSHKTPDYLDEILGINCGRGVDIVLEMLANVNLRKDLSVLAPRGRVVVIGSRGPIEIDPRQAMARDSSILGMSLPNTTPEELRAIHLSLGLGLIAGTLRPVIGQELPLADAARAHEAVMEGGSYGKIVLIP